MLEKIKKILIEIPKFEDFCQGTLFQNSILGDESKQQWFDCLKSGDLFKNYLNKNFYDSIGFPKKLIIFDYFDKDGNNFIFFANAYNQNDGNLFELERSGIFIKESDFYFFEKEIKDNNFFVFSLNNEKQNIDLFRNNFDRYCTVEYYLKWKQECFDKYKKEIKICNAQYFMGPYDQLNFIFDYIMTEFNGIYILNKEKFGSRRFESISFKTKFKSVEKKLLLYFFINVFLEEYSSKNFLTIIEDKSILLNHLKSKLLY